MAIVSMLLLITVCVYDWRARHGKYDRIAIESNATSQINLISGGGKISVEMLNHTGGGINDKLQFYEFKEVIGYCLIIPAIWLAIKIRSKLPRPGRRGFEPMKKL